jgi:hypothetical protein
VSRKLPLFISTTFREVLLDEKEIYEIPARIIDSLTEN